MRPAAVMAGCRLLQAIDSELRKLDVEQANQHVTYLCSFMPNSFMRRGGTSDVITFLCQVAFFVSIVCAQVQIR